MKRLKFCIGFCLICLSFISNVSAYETTGNKWIYPAGTHNTGGYSGWHASPPKYTEGYVHMGTDFHLEVDSPAYAITHGEIIGHADNLPGYASPTTPGSAILVQHWATGHDGHSRPFFAVYGHCRMVDGLEEKDIVLPGEPICKVHNYLDSSNNSKPHLHFGIRPDAVEKAHPYRGRKSLGEGDFDWVDPMEFLTQNSPGPSPVPCNQINKKFPKALGENGVACIDATFDPPNIYSIYYYYDDGTSCLVGTKKLTLTMNGQSIASAITSIDDDGAGGYGGGGDVTYSGASSSSKPELYVSKLSFRNGKRSYYDDETVHIDGYATNGGTSVSSRITKIAFNLYRFKGEKINGDLKLADSQNIKGENIGSGVTKHEEFSFDAPSEEDKYQVYAVIDDKAAVAESKENNNQSDTTFFRVHKRPNLKVINLTLDGGKTEFEQGANPIGEVTVTNTGGEPFNDVAMFFYLNGNRIDEQNMRHWNIEHGDVKHESTYLNTFTMSLGTHVLKACAELADDKDQSDNCMEIAFKVVAVKDILPDSYIQTDQTGLTPNTVVTTNPITISGFNAATAISITGGQYSINGSAYTSASGTVSNGDIVTVRLTSSGNYSTKTDATLTIGDASHTFSVTTQDSSSTSGSNSSSSSSSSVSVGGGSGGCFIATAAFGSPLVGQVEILRQFRDRYLLTNDFGRNFVVWYYRNGPTAAEFIKDKPLAKAAVRVALYPLIGISLLLISGYMPFAIIVFLLSALLAFQLRKRLRRGLPLKRGNGLKGKVQTGRSTGLKPPVFSQAAGHANYLLKLMRKKREY